MLTKYENVYTLDKFAITLMNHRQFSTDSKLFVFFCFHKNLDSDKISFTARNMWYLERYHAGDKELEVAR